MENLRIELEKFTQASSAGQKPPFPTTTLEALSKQSQIAPSFEPLLLQTLNHTSRSEDHTDARGRNSYEGEDLVRSSLVYNAMAALPASEAVLSAVLRTLKSSYLQQYFARPGSPDVDKFDRDVQIESAQDTLSHACLNALARHGKTQPKEALQQLKELGKHRDRRINSHAQDILRMLEYHAGL
jgi:hypothetical protein